MNHALLVAIVAGLSGMLGWGFADFFAKKTIDKVGDLTTLAWAHVSGATLLILLVLGKVIVYPGKSVMPKTLSEYGALVFFGILQALVYFLAYRAFSKGKLAILNPIFSSYSGLVVLISVLAFGEILRVGQFALLAIIFAGIIIVSLDEKAPSLKSLKPTNESGIGEILLAAMFAALWTVLWGHFVSGKDWLVYAAIMYIFMTLTLILVALQQKAKLLMSEKSIWKYFLFIGIGEVVAYVGISSGYSLTSHVSIVAVLSAAFSIPTLILAHVFLGERINKLQKVGVALTIIGVSITPLL